MRCCTPAASATACVTEPASARLKNVPGTDWAIARLKRPFAAVMASRAAITPAPAETAWAKLSCSAETMSLSRLRAAA